MNKIHFNHRKAGIVLAVLISIFMLTPSFTATIQNNKNEEVVINSNDISKGFIDPVSPFPAIPYDTNYIPEENVLLAGIQNDIGYNADAGSQIRRANPVYVGEPVVETVPGRGRTGSLNPQSNDQDDYYRFTVSEGQTITVSLSSSQPYSIELLDGEGDLMENGAESVRTQFCFVHIFASDDDVEGEYQFSVQLNNQNDANMGSDAGDDINSASSITPGTYSGYMSSDDVEDWYSFDVNAGSGITVFVEPLANSDYDIHLYNPSGALVHSAQYYGDDTLEYPADSSGTWKIKLDMFPGWDTSKWPDDYFLYGSGAYNLELEIGGDVDSLIEPMDQPEITPIAQTFIINDDPNSNRDEYGYLAAVPAANYIENGQRYVSPIVYTGVDFIPTWFTTVDQTTQYLLDDWNTYLDRHDLISNEYVLPEDPIQAAASIASEKWASSDTVVLTVDGSSFTDEIETVIDQDVSFTSNPEIDRVPADSLQDLGGFITKPLYLGDNWGAIHLRGVGNGFSGDTGLITPRFEDVKSDWWPYPYDSNGEDYDSFYPVSMKGFWLPYVSTASGLEALEIIKYEGKRYPISITDTDTSIKAQITTESESNLIVYLIDPEGNVRRPMVPHYNGGEIKPIHQWNGGHWEHDQDEFRSWILEPHLEFTVEVHNTMEGTWNAIVVPYTDEDGNDVGFSGTVHVTIEKRNYNEKRIDAALSAANAAVIASMNHAPLLFVKESEIPSETSNAITSLGANNIIFVNINDVSSANPSATNELTTMQEVIDTIKADSNTENFITITSLGTGEGYFAPAAMAAAYHTGPILNIGEVPDAYNTIDKIIAWREYAGDYYHGCLSVGHLPQTDHVIDLPSPPTWIQLIIYYLTHDQELPHTGLDLKLVWFSEVTGNIQNLVDGYGLDRDGQEAFLFVSPRDTDIRDAAVRAMVGNESFAGHIPVETTAFSTDVICRDILYPAVIYANPGRDVITSQFANYPDGGTWNANDGNSYPNFATRHDKESFFSRGRFYEGHIIIENLIERYNLGAALSYYSGHGTGGSGISGQFKNVAEDFPLAEIRHEHLRDFDWWDAWRGYSGYDNQQTKTPREGGESGYNSQEPNLYDFVHFKWCDQLFENLHSELEFWSSCTTGEHWGPIVYLSHGSAIWYGCAGSAYGIQDDLHNSWVFHDVLVNGDSIGAAQSRYQWIFNRDFTTMDPTTIYGRSTMFQLAQGGLTNVKVLFGDPTMTCYAPDWTEPTPVEG